MADKQWSSRLKEYLNTGLGRLTVVVVVAVVILGFAVVPSMIPNKVTDDDRNLASALVNLYNSPKVTVDGKASLGAMNMTAVANVRLDAKDMKEFSSHVGIDVKSPSSSFNVPIDFIWDSNENTSYFRVSNTSDVLDSMTGQLKPFKTSLSDIAKKLDNKWIYTKAATTPISDKKIDVCTKNLIDRVGEGSNAQDLLTVMLARSGFVEIDSVSHKDNNTIYRINFDSTKISNAMDTLKGSDFFKNTPKCDDSYDPMGINEKSTPIQENSSQSDAKSDISVVTDGENNITGISYYSKSQSNVIKADFNISYDKNIKITRPSGKNVMKYKDISKELKKALGVLLAPQMLQSQGIQGGLVKP